MNIKILDSWLRDYLDTDAKPQEIAEALSLTSVGIERIERWKNDYLYDIEITTNRPDLASVIGIAREAGAILPQFGYKAAFKPLKRKEITPKTKRATITIKNDPKLVNRICAVIMDVSMKPSPPEIANRLESTDIRSLNAIVDITNYVMRTIGYPTHVFDFDRLDTSSLQIRESVEEEEITTLDGKTHALSGGDIVAVDDSGRIVDLLGIMGLENSVVTPDTKRIMVFINNDMPLKIRKTSLQLETRTEAAQLNEKELDPELVMDALLYAIALYKEHAKGTVISDIIDIYPNKVKPHQVTVDEDTIRRILGVSIPVAKAADILRKLGFKTLVQGKHITADIPSFRLQDVTIPEDLVEEIARVYGYQNIPNILPPFSSDITTRLATEPFYWESRIKHALVHWGFTEVYTYPMVSEAMYEGDTQDAIKLKNPLGDAFTYMRQTLVPSLLQVVEENKSSKSMKLFEIGNIYTHKKHDLPMQTQHLALVIKKDRASFFELKGIIEQLCYEIGIHSLIFRPTSKSGLEAEIVLGKKIVGSIEMLDEDLLNAEIDFDLLAAHATNHKSFTPLQKYPPIIEDISLTVPTNVTTGEIVKTIEEVSSLIASVTLLDKYEDSRTFHILYQHPKRNITTKEVEEVRTKIIKTLEKDHQITLRK